MTPLHYSKSTKSDWFTNLTRGVSRISGKGFICIKVGGGGGGVPFAYFILFICHIP